MASAAAVTNARNPSSLAEPAAYLLNRNTNKNTTNTTDLTPAKQVSPSKNAVNLSTISKLNGSSSLNSTISSSKSNKILQNRISQKTIRSDNYKKIVQEMEELEASELAKNKESKKQKSKNATIYGESIMMKKLATLYRIESTSDIYALKNFIKAGGWAILCDWFIDWYSIWSAFYQKCKNDLATLGRFDYSNQEKNSDPTMEYGLYLLKACENLPLEKTNFDEKGRMVAAYVKKVAEKDNKEENFEMRVLMVSENGKTQDDIEQILSEFQVLSQKVFQSWFKIVKGDDANSKNQSETNNEKNKKNLSDLNNAELAARFNRQQEKPKMMSSNSMFADIEKNQERERKREKKRKKEERRKKEKLVEKEKAALSSLNNQDKKRKRQREMGFMAEPGANPERQGSTKDTNDKQNENSIKSQKSPHYDNTSSDNNSPYGDNLSSDNSSPKDSLEGKSPKGEPMLPSPSEAKRFRNVDSSPYNLYFWGV